MAFVNYFIYTLIVNFRYYSRILHAENIMASKGPRSKIDHETRAKRQKVYEVPFLPLIIIKFYALVASCLFPTNFLYSGFNRLWKHLKSLDATKHIGIMF